MFKVNNRSTRTRCEICSKLTIKTPIVNFEQVNADWVCKLNYLTTRFMEISVKALEFHHKSFRMTIKKNYEMWKATATDKIFEKN